jgi:hypothetical protein
MAMSDKQSDKNRKPVPGSAEDTDKKTSETVNLSSEELKRISGGVGIANPPSPNPGQGNSGG